jgi:hypothetical protein
MKRKADRIDKDEQDSGVELWITRDLDTCQDGFALRSFDSLDDYSLAKKFDS